MKILILRNRSTCTMVCKTSTRITVATSNPAMTISCWARRSHRWTASARPTARWPAIRVWSMHRAAPSPTRCSTTLSRWTWTALPRWAWSRTASRGPPTRASSFRIQLAGPTRSSRSTGRRMWPSSILTATRTRTWLCGCARPLCLHSANSGASWIIRERSVIACQLETTPFQ